MTNNLAESANNGISVTGIKALQGTGGWINSYFTIYCVNSLNYATFKRYEKSNESCKVSVKRFRFFSINFDSLNFGFAVVSLKEKIIKFYNFYENFGKNINDHCVCDDF